jgi:predicted NBD/HSP70 family sugar kinase
MYVGVDIGGTKTLLASLDDNGIITQKVQFPTPATYDEFLLQLKAAAVSLDVKNFRAGGVAAPGHIDHKHGIARSFGNLTWQDIPIQADAEHIFHCPIVIENDAKLGGLSESMLLPSDKRVLYVTISTGIGTGLIEHQAIVPALADSEGGHMILNYHGKWAKWESFASGRAIAKRFGKKASEITDEATWQRIAHDLAQGFIELIAIMQPDIIVIGGSVGQYFDKFKDFLVTEVKKYPDPLLPTPQFIPASRPNDAVIYGCYDLAKAQYGTNT